MKKLFLTIILCMLFMAPMSPAAAQTANSDVLLQQLQSLLIQLAALQEQLYLKQQGQVLGIETTKLNSSTYYTGSYVAIYLTEGILPIPYGETITTKRDLALWNLLRDVLGNQVVSTNISEFRIYDDRDSQFDAFVDEIGVHDGWVFGVNIAYSNLSSQFARENTIELFVHEYAHMLYGQHPAVATAFERTYWRPQSSDSRSYVSEYATESVEEDFAETFAYFVLNPSLQGNTSTDKKVRFFYKFDDFRDIREEIRDRLFD